MNDADRKAFMAWYLDFGFAVSSTMQEAVWQACCEWRDSQAGEPVGYTNEFQIEYVKNEAIGQGLMWATPNDESIPVFTTPPAAQINQQLFEALEKITEVDEDTPVKTYQEMERIAKAALAAAQNEGKRN